jgi:hypothetical protein
MFGVIGDAMGTPSENLEPADIEQRFGWVESFEGNGTDDTILRDMIAAEASVRVSRARTSVDLAPCASTRRWSNTVNGSKLDAEGCVTPWAGALLFALLPFRPETEQKQPSAETRIGVRDWM